MPVEHFYLLPVTQHPPKLPFRHVPSGGDQPCVRAGCGHDVYRFEDLMLGDQTVRKSKSKFPFWQAHLPAWLQRRLKKSCTLCKHAKVFEGAITCSFCGDIIFMGDPVSCYTSEPPIENFNLDMATQTPFGFVGCLAVGCCPSGGFYAGNWAGVAIHSPFQGGTLAGQAFLSGEVVEAHFRI